MIDEKASVTDLVGDVLARYCIGMDTGRMTDVLDVFAADATLTMFGQSATGTEEIRDLFCSLGRRAAGVAGLRATRHQLTTRTIAVESTDTVRSTAYVTVVTNLGLDNWGLYDDELRRIDGQWRITRRTLVVDGYTPGGVGAAMSTDPAPA